MLTGLVCWCAHLPVHNYGCTQNIEIRWQFLDFVHWNCQYNINKVKNRLYPLFLSSSQLWIFPIPFYKSHTLNMQTQCLKNLDHSKVNLLNFSKKISGIQNVNLWNVTDKCNSALWLVWSSDRDQLCAVLPIWLSLRPVAPANQMRAALTDQSQLCRQYPQQNSLYLTLQLVGVFDAELCIPVRD